jgi:hypothetical protein
LLQQRAKVDLGASKRRPVVVGQVKMRDAEVEGGAQQAALLFERRGVAKVVPKA